MAIPIVIGSTRSLYLKNRPAVTDNTKINVESNENNYDGTLKSPEDTISVIEMNGSINTYLSECMELLENPTFLILVVLGIGFYLWLRWDLVSILIKRLGAFYLPALFLTLQMTVSFSSLLIGGIYII